MAYTAYGLLHTEHGDLFDCSGWASSRIALAINTVRNELGPNAVHTDPGLRLSRLMLLSLAADSMISTIYDTNCSTQAITRVRKA